MKIKITKLPEAQIGKLTPMQRVNINNSPVGYADVMRQTGWVPPAMQGTASPVTTLDWKKFQEAELKKKYPWALSNKQVQNIINAPGAAPKQSPFSGEAVAGLMNIGLSFGANLIQGIQEQQDLSKATRLYGMTDAFSSPVANIYSRGRNVINTGEYAPNQMTPVQFAGRPVTEFSGFPNFPYNNYAQDGLSFTGDVMGMPSLITDVNSIATLPDVTSSPSLPPAVPEAPTTSEFMVPVQGYKISSGFGKRKAPIKGASSDHNGVDLAVPVNTAVVAPMDGVVEKVYENSKGGKQLIIRHSDGSRSGYAHLNAYQVNIGDVVSKGQKIALSGNTGNSSGPHLHFTYKNANGAFVNPIDFFNMKGGSSSKYLSGVSNWDHNNPGNIHIGEFASKYGATAGRDDNDGKVAIFPDMQTGLKAMEDLMFGSSYLNLTISQARNRWVNGASSEPTTSTPHIVNEMGGDYRMKDLSPEQRKKLLAQFIKWEDGNVYSNLKKKGYFQDGGEVELQNTNNMKIRITGVPDQTEFADGGKTVGDQMGYGLYRGQSVRDFNAFNKEDSDNYDNNVKSTEGSVPREEANIEAEEGEKIISPSGLAIMDIKGKKHSKGGVPMNAEPGSYIVSDFITAPKLMQAAMGFEVTSNKKKDNTWSKVLDSKVKSKDFNRLSQILQAAAAGKEVDQYEYATAKNKMPVYQDYVSKAALGNELTKMVMGKPYEIPDIAIPAMMDMFPEMAEKMGMGTEEEAPEAMYGKQVPQYQAGGLSPNVMDYIKSISKADIDKLPFTPWAGDKYENKENASKYTKQQWVMKLKAKGYNGNYTNEDIQKFLYSHPESKHFIDYLHRRHGDPKGGMFDKKLGYRWDAALDAIPDATPRTSVNLFGSPGPRPTVAVPPGYNVSPSGNTYSPSPSQQGLNWDTSQQSNLRKLPYTQDIVDLSAATANQFAYPTIGPYAAKYNATYMDPAFISTEAVDRLLQSQGKTAMEDTSLYGANPQTLAARQAQVNSQVIPGMIQNRTQTNAQNVQTDMMARQFDAQVANQEALTNAQVSTQLARDTAALAMNRAKERIAGRTASKNALNKMLTNAGDTYLMNQWYPQYAFNPMNYETYFKQGRDAEELFDGSGGQSQMTDLAAIQQKVAELQQDPYYKQNPDKAFAFAEKWYKDQKSKITTTSNPYNPMSRQVKRTDVAEEKYGGYIPVYLLGGWH